MKRCVFNAFLKVASASDCLTWTGRAFHSRGPVLAKLQSPQAVRVLGTVSCRPSELDLSDLVGARACSNSQMYPGAELLLERETCGRILKMTRCFTGSQ